jgi:GntR family transcriptional regulator/MocR family aminotransferase
MLGIELRRSGTLPLKRQIYLQIKNRILSGTLKSGEALPSTRAFSAEYEISRNTVSEAYEMLATEGFILCRQGAPVRVSDGLELAETTPVPVKPEKQDFTIAADFRTGRPDLRAFPRYLWQQLVNKAVLETPAEQLGYSDPAGLPMLRSEIAAWLYRSRGLTVEPGDLFITAGATHALFLAAELLCRRDDAMAIEDPCHTGMLRTLEHTGCRIIPVPVDDSGMQVPDFSRDKRIRALYVTPSHQFPLGSIMPAARRTALLRLAILNDTIIIEDDYDSEFRYCGEPLRRCMQWIPSASSISEPSAKPFFLRFASALRSSPALCKKAGPACEPTPMFKTPFWSRKPSPYFCVNEKWTGM